MEEKNKREEIQSRREFFKKAAKVALPVVGAAILSSVPFIKAEAATGCEFGCTTSCSGGCYQGCQGSCYGECKSGCKQGCYHGCRNTCDGTCSGGCARSQYA